MADLRTRYMGIDLKSPIVVGACSLSKQVDTIKQLEAAGAGAVIIKSLFEEQIQLEAQKFADSLTQYDAMYAEAVNMFPNVEHGGASEHLHWVEKTKKAVKIPLIASLNCVDDQVWVDWAKRLAETGVDGLELNFYSLPLDPTQSANDIEKRELDVFAAVKAAVKVPVSVKLHPYYTNLMRVAAGFDALGADGLVLFNRFFQPDLDVEELTEKLALKLSTSQDSLQSLRWTALLYGKVKADLVASTGVMQGADVVKMILAGASSVQVVSTLYTNKITHIKKMNREISAWMDEKGFKSLDAFRGKASKKAQMDPWAFERGQYIKALLGFD